MITEVPTLSPTTTIGEVGQLLERNAKNYKSINYLYVVDGEQRLIGVLSIKEMFVREKTKMVNQLMQTKLIVVHPHTDQEHVAARALEHNLKAIPVVDQAGKFLGAVPSDAILRILHAEHIEDVLLSTGIHSPHGKILDTLSTPALELFKLRIPWLVVGLGGGLASAGLIGSFEHALRDELLLAAFIPTVVYLADAVGTQSETIFVRSLAIHPEAGIVRYIVREMRVAVLLAITLAVLLGMSTWLWHQSLILSLTLSSSITITVLLAAGIAIFLPWVFQRFKVDPAIATGPLATVVQDIISLAIYFSIAASLLRLLPLL